MLLDHFWDDEFGMVVEQWDESWTTLDGYRGVNANMHTVEALLSAADVLDDSTLRDRALRIVTRVVHDLAPAHEWRIPEHFDASWTPLLEYNADEPAHPFRPYGATIGHWLEWARLALHLRAALGSAAPDWLLDGRRSRCSTPRSARAGRSTAPTGSSTPSTGPAAPSYASGCTGSPPRPPPPPPPCTRRPATRRTPTGTRTWWQHIDTCFRDPVHGSWHHELSPTNEPSSVTWEGKPDTYHAYQATLIPRLPLAPTLAKALAEDLLRIAGSARRGTGGRQFAAYGDAVTLSKGRLRANCLLWVPDLDLSVSRNAHPLTQARCKSAPRTLAP